MGSLWRSEPMQLIQLYIQKEAVRDTVDELGQLGIVQFRDLNPEINAFQRSFVNEIKRFDEMQRKIRFFEEQLTKAQADGTAPTTIRIAPASPVDDHRHRSKTSSKVMIDELEAKLDEYEKDLVQMNQNQEILDRNFNELVELENVLEKDATFFDEAGGFDASGPEDQQPLLSGGDEVAKGGSLGFVTGVIPSDKIFGFERVIWRATRGNIFMKHACLPQLIKDPQSGEMVAKDVFIIFFQGSRLQEKIKRLCDSFGVSLYHCPATTSARAELRSQVRGRLQDLTSILTRTKDHSRSVLSRIADSVNDWKATIVKEKAIYHTLNLFNNDLGRKCLIAEAWCPISATADIQRALQKANERSGAMVPSILTVIHTHEQPPTYFKTDKYTQAFQGIVDSYGIARYHEVNPAVFTIVTFPFLFGVMFGDLGHGAILASVALYLVLNEKKLAASDIGEMGKNLFEGRYILLLMGFFAMYVGLIYNETFALPMNIFGSDWVYPNQTTNYPPGLSDRLWCWAPLDPPAYNRSFHTPPDTACLWNPNSSRYLFGVDPTWKNANNDLSYYNSLKMKLSVIFGLVQMLLGITLSAFNAVHFKKLYNFIFEFVPQVVFMLSIFGYMVFLIFLKWSIPWTDLLVPQPYPDWGPVPTLQGLPPPNILNVVIQMFLSPFSSKPDYTYFAAQQPIQITLLILSLVSVPIMLFAKPYCLNRDHKNKLARQGSYQAVAQSEEDEHEEEFEFSEIMVHQIIHTIEFVLGAVSNTASYLRLWALSLAHAELAAVFWEMIMLTGLSATGSWYGIPMVFVCFAAWAALTVAVLLLMESLSAFLHALRLHWVEFQNKFYMGDGYAFLPFSYDRILLEEAEAEASIPKA